MRSRQHVPSDPRPRPAHVCPGSSSGNRRGLRCRQKGRRAFNLVDLLVVVFVVAVLTAMFLPMKSYMNGRCNRTTCASNLRQIGQAMQMYSNAERDGAYPRTLFNSSLPLDLVSNPSGNFGFSMGTAPIDSFDTKKLTVLPNSVGASFFLLLKTQYLTPQVFVCPSSNATGGFQTSKVQNSANFGGWKDNYIIGYSTPDCSYSMQTPFPDDSAVRQGLKTSTLPSDLALAADVNPGRQQSNGVWGSPATVKAGDPMAAGPGGSGQWFGNSRNHQNQGQNVLYADGHVEFQTSCFSGAYRSDPTTSYRDNIYTNFFGVSARGDGGLIVGKPQDLYDSVLLPAEN